jgi:hypothetical protein
MLVIAQNAVSAKLACVLRADPSLGSGQCLCRTDQERLAINTRGQQVREFIGGYGRYRRLKTNPSRQS